MSTETKKVLVSINDLNGLVIDDVKFSKREVHFKSGSRNFVLQHYSWCCEDVSIENAIGDISNFIGNEIIASSVDSSFHENSDGDYFRSTYTFRTTSGALSIPLIQENASCGDNDDHDNCESSRVSLGNLYEVREIDEIDSKVPSALFGKHWYMNGKLHRTDGPAVEYVPRSGHREDGPA